MFHLISDLFNRFHFNWTSCFVGLKQLEGPFWLIKSSCLLPALCYSKPIKPSILEVKCPQVWLTPFPKKFSIISGTLIYRYIYIYIIIYIYQIYIYISDIYIYIRYIYISDIYIYISDILAKNNHYQWFFHDFPLKPSFIDGFFSLTFWMRKSQVEVPRGATHFLAFADGPGQVLGLTAEWWVNKPRSDLGVSENGCTPKPNGFADQYPYEMAISLGIYPTFSDKPKYGASKCIG